MGTLLAPSYNVPLVALSYFISVAGSFIALVAARRIVGPDGRINRYHAATAGLALGGIGAWSMHFIGMLALQLHVGVSYSMLETLTSLVAAAVATAVALAYVAAAPRRIVRLLVAGFLLGMGIVVMHYLGMLGMRFGGFIEWSYSTIGLSMLIAVLVSTVALWLAFNTRTLAVRALAACVMGGAVCSMHYTGMTAASFICTTAIPRAIPSGPAVVSGLQLHGWVLMFTMAALFLLALDQFVRYTADVPPRSPAKKKPVKCLPGGHFGEMFHPLRLWAYQAVQSHEGEESWLAAAQYRAAVINAGFVVPLPFKEVRGIAKATARWVWKHRHQLGGRHEILDRADARTKVGPASINHRGRKESIRSMQPRQQR